MATCHKETTEFPEILPAFAIKEPLKPDPTKVYSGIAVKPSDKLGRRKIVTERYLERGYIQPEQLSADGTYKDEFEPVSIPIVSKIDGRVVASIRLIKNTPRLGLPVNSHEEITIVGDWKKEVVRATFELSQLAKSKEYYKDPRAIDGLIRTYMQISRALGILTSVGVIDDGVKEYLNGPHKGFNLPQIGPAVNYMGSLSIPIWIHIPNVTASARKNGHHELAEFLEGKDSHGFEWYVGP